MIRSLVIAPTIGPLAITPFIYVIGIGSAIFGYLFNSTVLGSDAIFTLNIMHEYLIILENINKNVTSNINNFSSENLQELLGIFESMIFIHEHIFEIPLITDLLNSLEENSSMFHLYNGMFERWRGIGNDLLETYRNIENMLNIPISNSRIPATWHE